MNSLWDIINVPFGFVIRFCNKIVGGNYILALLIFAVILEIVLLPFGIKQQKNSIKQAKLRPKEMAIRKKYAGRDDQPTKQKMTMEIQELYQKEGFNPMGGCLPLLIQFPILIALYNIVMSPLHYICQLSTTTIQNLVGVVNSYGYSFDVAQVGTRNIDLMGAVKNILADNPVAFSGVEGFNLTAADLPNLTVFGAIDLGAIPSFKSFDLLLLIPVLTFVVYFFSMKLTRKLSYQPTTANDPAMGCSNKMMDIVMPLFSVYITFIVPAAIGVYWIFKSILGVLKQWILKKTMPIPVFTEEDYKAAEKEMNVRADNKPKNKSGKVVRSLHHIDDEDFADTAEKAKAHKAALEAQEAAEPKPQKSSLIQGAVIKEDDKPERKSKKEKESDMENYRKSISDQMDQADNADADNENHTDGEVK
ncbi:MAG: membrane protein insertase YidC [Clostridia bacterium]|nr:membrane protein insertase YidC [Clostridia bacterium]